ncbi:FACT complex subunit SSRP1 [Hypsibius exemplaris]|uniref:FACT complex subunit SSRP1 n=1 Tax=Hypsibius exemplaris TaxID=2072580 RepID=A0A1W0X3E1_HYPEX|nr:FACT complex subunit SSRP1 [Hypsibius exemplaris]
MNLDSIEFSNASQEVTGSLVSGKLSFNNRGLVFRNPGTGKNLVVAPTDWEDVFWIRIAGAFGLKFFLKSGPMHQFAGFKETDFEPISKFFRNSYQIDLKEEDKSLKGWNWGSVKFRGKVLEFNVERQVGFHLPLNYVSQCTTGKNEAVLEFHAHEDASVALMEMRFYIPQEGAEGDPLESFHQNVLDKADIVQATGEALMSLHEVPSLTPRGRYELKVYPTFLQLHGKTFDYKITYSSILRIFILPHPDSRQMFFVLSLDPPIKQGQTRYPFLILNFKKEEDSIEVDLEIPEKELKEKYDGRLEKHLSGQTYEVLGRVLKGLVNRKITVPGAFKGTTGSSLSCSYKAAVGFLYPLDRGFVFVHKPAIHVRFDEISAVNFARSGGNTRSFDFELETKNGQTHTFNGLGKEEYSKLFDYVTEKGLRVKNRGDKDEGASRKIDMVLDSDEDEEHDAYMQKVKNEGRARDDGDDEEDDEDFKPQEDNSDVAEEFDSDAGGSSEEDEDGESKPKKEKEKKKKKANRYDDEVGDGERKKKRKKEGKKDKDPNMPKRPLSAYMIWLNEARDKIKADFPGISVVDISKKAGELWKQVTDHKKWDDKAAEAKKEYDIKMREYEKKRRDEDNDEDDEGASSSKQSKKSSQASKKSSKPSSSTSSPNKMVKSDEFVATDDDTSSSDDDKAARSKKRAKSSEESEVELSD